MSDQGMAAGQSGEGWVLWKARPASNTNSSRKELATISPAALGPKFIFIKVSPKTTEPTRAAPGGQWLLCEDLTHSTQGYSVWRQKGCWQSGGDCRHGVSSSSRDGG